MPQSGLVSLFGLILLRVSCSQTQQSHVSFHLSVPTTLLVNEQIRIRKTRQVIAMRKKEKIEKKALMRPRSPLAFRLSLSRVD